MDFMKKNEEFDSGMKQCKFCKQPIDKKASMCPYCRKSQYDGCLFKGCGLPCLIVIMLLVFSALIFSGNDTKNEPETQSKASTSRVTINTGTKTEAETSADGTQGEGAESGSTETEPPAETEAPAEESSYVLYEENGIKITYTGHEVDMFNDFSINVLIENNSDKSYMVQERDFSINGYMVDAMFSSEVAPGKKINDKIKIWESDFKDNGISTDSITDAEFYFHIFNADDWSESYDSEIITIDF